MKKPDSHYRLLVVISLIVLTIVGVAINKPLSYAAYFDCCSPPLVNPMAGRFQQNAQVTVYIPTNSGLTPEEIGGIKVAIEDWNDEDNNSGVLFNVVEQDPPGQQINNTIIVNFIDSNNPNTGGGALTMRDQRTIQGEVTKTWGTLTLWANHRTLQPPSNRIVQLRNTARHEAGHGLGLDNANDCAPGSTIMNPSWTEETFITDCDNNKIDTDPVYPPPTPTPSPAPTPEESGQFDCNDGDDNDGDGLIDCDDTCNQWCINGCNARLNQICWDLGAPQCINGQCYTPILIDVLGDGHRLTNAQNGILFNVLPGRRLRIGWTRTNSDDAWLTLDRNGNGQIDSGEEMFGNATPQPPSPPQGKNGFLALAVFDQLENGGNGDGVIDKQDSVFAELRLWQDRNHNGISEEKELLTLKQLGLKSIDLEYKESKRTDPHGNKFMYRAKVTDEHDAQLGRWAWDVFLVAR